MAKFEKKIALKLLGDFPTEESAQMQKKINSGEGIIVYTVQPRLGKEGIVETLIVIITAKLNTFIGRTSLNFSDKNSGNDAHISRYYEFNHETGLGPGPLEKFGKSIFHNIEKYSEKDDIDKAHRRILIMLKVATGGLGPEYVAF